MPTFPKKSAPCMSTGGSMKGYADGGQFSFGQEDEAGAVQSSEEKRYEASNAVTALGSKGGASAAQEARNTAEELAMGGKQEADQAEKRARDELLPKAKKKGLSAFETAFAAARKAGDKTFTFKGKSYTTAMKK